MLFLFKDGCHVFFLFDYLDKKMSSSSKPNVPKPSLESVITFWVMFGRFFQVAASIPVFLLHYWSFVHLRIRNTLFVKSVCNRAPVNLAEINKYGHSTNGTNGSAVVASSGESGSNLTTSSQSWAVYCWGPYLRFSSLIVNEALRLLELQPLWITQSTMSAKLDKHLL